METKTMGGVPEKLHTNYPSRFEIGEKVTLDFWLSGKIKGCTVDAVRFTEGKVRYDILVPIKETSEPEEQPSYLTLIENVDSVCVVDAD